MQIIDITRTISARLATYPLNPPYRHTRVRDMPGSPSALSEITLGTHTGTHVDAPRHVIPDGKGIEAVPLRALIAPAVILDCTEIAEVITAADLRRQDVRADHLVLLKTRNSFADPAVFHEGFVACEESAAQLLADAGCRAVGIDGPSIKKFHVRDRTHHIFLERGIPVIEGLDLARAAAGPYALCVCLPLPIDGGDGAPARAVLLRMDEIAP